MPQHTKNQIRRRASVAAAAVLALVLIGAPSAFASGGVAAPSGTASSGGGCGGNSTGKPGNAKLVDGAAVAPSNAPAAVCKAIAAGNKIRNKPYRWGGGHGKWEDSGYDCSGAVSYLLHAAGLLKRPLDSGGLARLVKKKKGKKKWRKGVGDWITIRANGGHTYIVVAGLRMDTSGTGGKGPRWHSSDVHTSKNGPYTVLHPKKF